MPRELSLLDFHTRFVAEMVRIAGQNFDDGGSVADYASETAEIYWREQHVDGETPEDCAQSDIDCWE